MNIKYKQEYSDTIALTNILFEAFAAYLPLFIVAFLVDNSMAKIYSLMLQLIIKDMGYFTLFSKWYNQFWENRIVKRYKTLVKKKVWKRFELQDTMVQARAQRIKKVKEETDNPLYTEKEYYVPSDLYRVVERQVGWNAIM